MVNKLTIVFVLLLMIVVGCSTKVDLLNQINLNKSLYTSDGALNTTLGADDIKSNEIQIGSNEYSQFIVWLKNNEEGWRSTPASYIGGKLVHQNNFNLRVLENSVVVSFIDEGEGKQYYNSIEEGELDFLFLADD